jgi:outer membrane protein OmpA-like peptidoglycan-associated protein
MDQHATCNSMNTTSSVSASPVALCMSAFVLSTGLVASPVSAQVLNNPTVDQLIGALAVSDGAQSAKAFRRTLPPDSNNLCPEGQVVSAGSGKNIVVVPYHLRPSARVDIPMLFGDDSDALNEADRKTLDNIAQAMKSLELQDARFALAGHTSTTGARARNLELSCARSLAVRRYLVEKGVSADRLTAYGFGFDKPLPGRPGEDASNRRVEINRE